MRLFLSIWITGLMLVQGSSAEEQMQPLEGLRVPVDFYPDGTLKHELIAKKAKALEDGSIDAEGIEFRLFTPQGEEEVVIRAQQAKIDRATLKGSSEKPVSLMREKLLLTGEGFEWKGKAETIRILRRVRLSFPSSMFQEKSGEEDATNKEN